MCASRVAGLTQPVLPATVSDMSPIENLLRILDLEQLDNNLWRGISPDTSRYRVFGGQVIAQSLVAAMRSWKDGGHSLHGYFMLGGDPTLAHPL